MIVIDQTMVEFESPENQVIQNTPKSSKISPYSRPQSLGKAVKKSVGSLPYSPRKRRLIVAGLAKYVGLKIENTAECELHGNKQGNPGLSDETLSRVEQFFFRSDIVYTAPGMRDEMTVWKGGKKIKLRKYFLTMFMREAFAVFQGLNPQASVSFAKFCSLRPENVLLLKNTPVDQKDICWKYFATSHGKGVVVCIGGRAKSLVCQKVMSKNDTIIVNNSLSFAKLITELMPSTDVVHISQKEIYEIITAANPWEDVPAMPSC
jgi:hypothetical protein